MPTHDSIIIYNYNNYTRGCLGNFAVFRPRALYLIIITINNNNILHSHRWSNYVVYNREPCGCSRACDFIRNVSSIRSRKQHVIIAWYDTHAVVCRHVQSWLLRLIVFTNIIVRSIMYSKPYYHRYASLPSPAPLTSIKHPLCTYFYIQHDVPSPIIVTCRIRLLYRTHDYVVTQNTLNAIFDVGGGGMCGNWLRSQTIVHKSYNIIKSMVYFLRC